MTVIKMNTVHFKCMNTVDTYCMCKVITQFSAETQFRTTIRGQIRAQGSVKQTLVLGNCNIESL